MHSLLRMLIILTIYKFWQNLDKKGENKADEGYIVEKDALRSAKMHLKSLVIESRRERYFPYISL